jgi:hypothetical protein
MAEKGSKKSTKATSKETGVLASLPATRPNRMSSRRRGPATATPAKPAPVAKRKPAARKAKPAAPKIAAVAEATPQRPRPVRSASKGLAEPARKAAAKRAPAPEKAPSGTELVTTVVQAAGELAQVGLSIGGQVLKRAVERLPKP